VSRKEGITKEQVKGIMDRYLDTQVDWEQIRPIRVLGIDEISLRKGHQSFIVIISSLIKGKQPLIALLKGRKKSTVKQFLETMPETIKANIQWVCSDMYKGFINASEEVFDKTTRVVIDRFHVAKLYRQPLDHVRKRELKRLKNMLSVSQYKRLKGAMWTLRRSPHDLSEQDTAILARLFRYSRPLAETYQATQELTTIFNKSPSRASGVRRLKVWIKSAKVLSDDPFSKFIKTLRYHFDHIANYFVARKNSGFVEGLNNKIKVIKRRCYGIFRCDHLFQRITLDIQGYAMFK
jgi:transposase